MFPRHVPFNLLAPIDMSKRTFAAFLPSRDAWASPQRSFWPFQRDFRKPARHRVTLKLLVKKQREGRKGEQIV
ncbi:MAG TPA: hypothetical protein VIY69_04070, partial [Candidatus Acidoferrales bacterium]